MGGPAIAGFMRSTHPPASCRGIFPLARVFWPRLLGLGWRFARMQGNLNRLFPGEDPEVPEGGAVWVFALE